MNTLETFICVLFLSFTFMDVVIIVLCVFLREGGDTWLDQSPKFYDNIFKDVTLPTLGTFITF